MNLSHTALSSLLRYHARERPHARTPVRREPLLFFAYITKIPSVAGNLVRSFNTTF